MTYFIDSRKCVILLLTQLYLTILVNNNKNVEDLKKKNNLYSTSLRIWELELGNFNSYEVCCEWDLSLEDHHLRFIFFHENNVRWWAIEKRKIEVCVGISPRGTRNQKQSRSATPTLKTFPHVLSFITFCWHFSETPSPSLSLQFHVLWSLNSIPISDFTLWTSNPLSQTLTNTMDSRTRLDHVLFQLTPTRTRYFAH